MNGWGNYSSSDAEIITSWMWKRHTGFDVVTYIGTGSNMSKNHSMNAVPQMMWVMNRDQAGENIASNTRKDVMQQIQKARSIPQSVSHSNSAQVESNPTDDVFDVLKGADEADNLFG